MITRVVWAVAWADGQGVTYDKDSSSRGAAMSDPAIIEAAARALHKAAGGDFNEHVSRLLATAVLAAVTPLIRAAALEEAAREAALGGAHGYIVTVIRALKEQP